MQLWTNGAVEKWITGEMSVATQIAGLLLSTCGVSCRLEDEMLICPQGGPTSTLTLTDLPRTVRGRPLASAGVCGGCYTFSYSSTKGAVMVGHGPLVGE